MKLLDRIFRKLGYVPLREYEEIKSQADLDHTAAVCWRKRDDLFKSLFDTISAKEFELTIFRANYARLLQYAHVRKVIANIESGKARKK